MMMRVVAVPQLQDNYGWLIIDDVAQVAAIVDPADADVVREAVAREGVRLTAIFNTHHHWDHTGGNQGLLAADSGIAVYGFAADRARIPGITHPIGVDDVLRVGALEGRVLFVPCHTTGHIAYVFGEALFSGDTLFAAGCGRFFEGTAAEMYRALYDVLGALPDTTRIYCGHEYTVRNLEFALTVEPHNPAIARKLEEARALRDRSLPTVPTTLGEERTYNPFLRVFSPELRAKVAPDSDDPVRVLAAVRALKDAF